MEFQVLSPRGEVEKIENIQMQPRVTDLHNKTIGFFVSFKGHWALILEEIERQLKDRFPNAKFTYFRYTKELLTSHDQFSEVEKDPVFRPSFEEWLSGVDAVISANGDAGSCTLYLTYNTSAVERLGKPVVMTVNPEFVDLAKRAAALRGVPALRYVEMDLPDISIEPSLDEFINEIIPQRVSDILDDIITALTSPLTPNEKNPENAFETFPRIVHKGSLQEINKFFYKKGWAYGMPIIPPTEEAVQEMLTGTDLPPDYVVAKIPPMMGSATVEKIAVNAVMAGCLPTYMPVVIAAVKALVDPGNWVEGYTISMASWAPLLIINGPIRKDLNVNSGTTLFSPYHRANAAIAHALGLIIMNIAGVRPHIEDKGALGHEGRFGICIAEDEENSPWEPLHEFYGLNKEDSAVTLFWPNTRGLALLGEDIGAILAGICDIPVTFGFDPGCAFIICPAMAKKLQSNGYTRKDLVSYLVEYARKPATEVPVRWFKENHHLPKEVLLPADPSRSVRKYFSGMHLPIVVAGMKESAGVAYYGGGGDHGGPITKKIELPKNWATLKDGYKDFEPDN